MHTQNLKQLTRTALAKTALTSMILTVLLTTANASNAGEAPNILLLVAEDLGPRIGSYGDTVAHTPNLDELARRGARFSQVFTTAGVCAPSRAALITGQHQISFGAQNMRTSTGPLGPYLALPPKELRAFPEILRGNGYFTFTDRKLDYQFSGINNGSGPFTIWDAQGDLGDFPNNVQAAPWRKRKNGQPFFALINFLETHESGVMRPTGKPYSQSHANTQKFRHGLQLVPASTTDPKQIQLPPYYPDLAEIRQDIARHYDNIHAMDSKVGAILTALEKDNLADSTIIIWTTDHGDGLPRAKREVLDTGIHVPMIIYVPEKLAKQHLAVLNKLTQTKTSARHRELTGQLISFVDLAPTILGLAGISPPDYLHGRNFLHNANKGSPKYTKRQYIYASRDRIDEVIDKQRAIRSHRYKYIRSDYPQVPGGHPLAYRDNLDMTRAWRSAFVSGTLPPHQNAWFLPTGRKQLYDLKEDPYELNNLAQAPQLAHIVRSMDKALNEFIDKVGDTGREPENKMRDRFLLAGEIPKTPPAQITWINGKAVITSPIGASVGYRIISESPAEANSATKAQSWELYRQPIDANTIEAKSVRYGWQASDITTSQRPRE